MDFMGHWDDSFSEESPQYECDDCSDGFSDEEDLRDHEVEVHHYCDPCRRYFQSYNNIRQHLNSRIHRGKCLSCPFCGHSCSTATGLVNHLEQGGCPKAPLDRDSLYQAVRRRDPNGVICKKLLEWHGSTTYTVTERTFNANADAYECYLCHRLFTTLTGLNAHLNSPIHKQKLYNCPNRQCRKDFTTLAGVINHLESESCNFMRFESVQKNVERIVDPRRMIQF
ncbi:hypothetical protein EsH8_IV_001223 [Colletotrichum jinshuiense]